MFTNILGQGPVHQWARTGSNPGTNEEVVDLDVDPFGNVLVLGHFGSYQTPSMVLGTSGGSVTLTGLGTGISPGRDLFIAKYDASGNLVFAFPLGNQDFMTGRTILADPTGGFYVAGRFQDTLDLDPGSGTALFICPPPIPPLTESSSEFLARYDAMGNYVMAFILQGAGIHSMALAVDGNIWVAGSCSADQDLDSGPGTWLCGTLFLAKYDPEGHLLWAADGPASSTMIRSVALDAQGTIHFAGSLSGTVDLDTGPEETILAGGQDLFFGKMSPTGQLIYAKLLNGSDA
ncbi:MAG TPA: hypothetical protein VKG92_01310, partial [Flavobacteriales bacterium]|nr:hypothetical protein [Flavobacteriales bacterium]